ncbi:phosphopantetheine-binding protein [Saccharomonospora xinjiangensis]|uniref:Phosphopantetheine-containing protein n=1 Tax=Saccharomonospora xinjiangensis XJ-54 TaxID=882086 RepID=I0UY20_9PSEU|nr:phosphopantetheine-binding protein [Saccharomonospora xinjiangensis]EID52773.1 phosphopantetheine-containing protein [Saccharomonospora xinjiangensis XJ-54]
MSTTPPTPPTPPAPLSPDQAREAVRAALLGIVPDAELDDLRPDENLRQALELDSLDFLTFVRRLAGDTGRDITEDDYLRLETFDSCVEFLTSSS